MATQFAPANVRLSTHSAPPAFTVAQHPHVTLAVSVSTASTRAAKSDRSIKGRTLGTLVNRATGGRGKCL